MGWTSHEVSTITKRGGDWETLWLSYFDPYGPPGFTDVHYQRTVAGAPPQLGDTVQAWADGWATSPSFGALHDFSDIPEMSDCAAPTEPALLTHGGETYLATNCLVFVAGQRRPDLERLMLLKETPAGYEYVGTLLDYDDAVAFGGERIEQADLAIAQNGAVLLIATPIQTAEPYHMGCKVLEVMDLETAAVRREPTGDTTVLASITGEDDNIGPGLCTYDAESSTGVVMVLHDQQTNPLDVEFSMRATGVHPLGVDSDGDGLADTTDPCPTFAPSWQTPAGDSDCDGYPDSAVAPPVAFRAPESAIGTLPGQRCAATPNISDEDPPDAWPPDFNDNQLVNGADWLSFNNKFGSSSAGGPPYDVRWDLNGSGIINGGDMLQLNVFFGRRCD
jgi:hypothetical protein